MISNKKFKCLTMSIFHAYYSGKSDSEILSLINRDNINSFSDNSIFKMTILVLSICNERENLALKLLDNPFIDLNIELLTINFSEQQTPLVLACTHKLEKVALKILDKMASVDYPYKFDVNWCDIINNSLLMYACYFKLDSVINKLLELNCNIDIKNLCKVTANIIACSRSATNIALKLIKRGCDIHIQTTNNDTALIYATFNKLNQVVFKLLDKKVNVTIRRVCKYLSAIHMDDIFTFFDSGIKYNQHKVLKYYYLKEISQN